MPKTRSPKFASQFYPEDPLELRNYIDNYLVSASIEKIDNLKALIVPHAGYIYSGPIAGYGYKSIKKNYKKIILLGLSHQVPFDGLGFTDYSYFSTPLGKVKCFSPKNINLNIQNEAHEIEHSIEVQIPFLQITQDNFNILPILTGKIDNIDKYIEEVNEFIDENSLLIVSSDLSHYLPYDIAVDMDRNTIKKILSGKNIDHDEACGADGINILINIAKKNKWKSKLLDLRNSGDTASSKDQVVGYCSIAFFD